LDSHQHDGVMAPVPCIVVLPELRPWPFPPASGGSSPSSSPTSSARRRSPSGTDLANFLGVK